MLIDQIWKLAEKKYILVGNFKFKLKAKTSLNPTFQALEHSEWKVVNYQRIFRV